MLLRNKDLENLLSLIGHIINFKQERDPQAMAQQVQIQRREESTLKERKTLTREMLNNDKKVEDEGRVRREELEKAADEKRALITAEIIALRKNLEALRSSTKEAKVDSTQPLNQNAESSKEAELMAARLLELDKEYDDADAAYQKFLIEIETKKRFVNFDLIQQVADVDRTIARIRADYTSLPNSTRAYIELTQETTNALMKISKKSLASPQLGDRLIELFQKDHTILGKWIQSSIVMDSITQSSKFNSFFETLMKMPKVDDETLIAISKLRPVYIINQKNPLDPTHQTSKEVLEFQQAIEDVKKAFDAVNLYTKKSKNTSLHDAPDTLDIARKKKLEKLVESLQTVKDEDTKKETFSSFTRMVDNYHIAHGKIHWLTSQIAQVEKEYQEIGNRIVSEGNVFDADPSEASLPPDQRKGDWFAQSSALYNKLFKLQQALSQTQSELQDLQSKITISIQNYARDAERAYVSAKTKPDYDTFRKHHFFSKKPLGATSVMSLLKNLVMTLKNANEKLNKKTLSIEPETQTTAAPRK